jgi:tellurite methyltransferase
MNWKAINNALGATELFVVDQLLKGRFPEGCSLLDAGCGEGRNLHYFLHHPYSISAIDHYPMAIRMLELIVKSRKPPITPDIRLADVLELPYDDGQFDVSMAISVLHFLRSAQEIEQALAELSRVTKVDGHILIQTATIGNDASNVSSDFFPIQLDQISDMIETLPLELAEPTKVIHVQHYQSLLQLVLRKIAP